MTENQTVFCGQPQNLPRLVSAWFNDPDTSSINVNLQNNRAVYCHRAILRSWSPVWAAALQDESVGSLDLCTHDAAIVEMCLKYCHGFNIELTDDNLTRVHFFAYQYNLEELQARCEKVMTEAVSVSNCLRLYCYFCKHNLPSLSNAQDSIKTFVCNEFLAVAKSDEFLRISADVLCDFLEADILSADEDDVLDACCSWLGDSPDPRARERVFARVRFPRLSGQKLVKFKYHPLFQPDLEARHNFAMQWVLIRQSVGESQESLRAQLASEAKNDDHLTPRHAQCLEIQSKILDPDMTGTLGVMLGGKCKRIARLLVACDSNFRSPVFDKAVTGQGPFICIIKTSKGHVFGGYVEDTFGTPGDWIDGSPNNFLFSLKDIPPQKVVKLKRTQEGKGIFITCGGLSMGDGALDVFCDHSTEEDTLFELAPGYESVGTKTLHGEFGKYTPERIEVFAFTPAL